MEGSLGGKPRNNWLNPRVVMYRSCWLTAFSACVLVLSSSAHAQLRSGRVTRDIYQNDRAERQADVRQGTATVQTASYVQPAKGGSIREGAGVVTASCSDCDAGRETSFVDGESTYIDHQPNAMESLGGGCGCDACSGGYGGIAPTCMSVGCQPGCGPLLALWCRMSVRAEVPLYWRRAAAPPALVTTSPTGTASSVAGQLGQSTTSILLGDGTLNQDANAGFRITLGTYLSADESYGILFRYWDAGDQDDTFTFNSSSTPILARPFLNTTTNAAGIQDTQLIAFPGDSVGNLTVAATSSVNGLELSLRRLLYQDRFTRVDWLYGYQHVSIDEGLSISSNTSVTGNIPALQGSSIMVTDRFQTENDFNGVSYGVTSTRRFACWKMETLFRMGLGNLRRKVNIGGSTTTVSSAGATATQAQGLLARNTNNQPFQDDTFIVVPEVGLNLAYCIRPGLDFTVGYNYLLIPKVAQASHQIDSSLAVNLSDPLVGSLDPQRNFDERDYWLHSLGLGLQLRY